jgi:hypothetical protein
MADVNSDRMWIVPAVAFRGPPLIEIGAKLFMKAHNGVLSQTAMDPLAKWRYDVALLVCEARVTASIHFLHQMSPILDRTMDDNYG